MWSKVINLGKIAGCVFAAYVCGTALVSEVKDNLDQLQTGMGDSMSDAM